MDKIELWLMEDKFPQIMSSSSIRGDSRFRLQEELHLPVITTQFEVTRHPGSNLLVELGIRMSILRPQVLKRKYSFLQ